MLQYVENIFFAAEEAELDLCEEWRDWKNDAKSPKDLFPLRDFNKNPNCLFSRNVHLPFILSLPFFAEVPNTLKVKRRTWFKSLKLSILSFYKVHRSDDWIVLQDSVESNFVFDLEQMIRTNSIFPPSTVLILFYLKTWYQSLTYLVGLYKVCGPAPSPIQTPKKLYGFEDGKLVIYEKQTNINAFWIRERLTKMETIYDFCP